MIRHERSIDFKNGLVDPNALLEFMVGCHCEDLGCPVPRGSHFDEAHHLVFPKEKVKRHPRMIIGKLKNSKYNLIQMQKCQEDYYHQTVWEEVPLDQIDTDAAQDFMEEADTLTAYAATSLLRTELNDLLTGDRGLSRAEEARCTERLAIVEEAYHQDLQAVERITVIAHSVVTGALINYLVQRPEPEMQSLIQRRLTADERIVPTQIYSPDALFNVAYRNLSKRMGEGDWSILKNLAVVKPVAA